MNRILNIKHLGCGKGQFITSGLPRFDHELGVYIGRLQSGTHFGNPFSHHPHHRTTASVIVGTREEAVLAYGNWLEGKDHLDVEPYRKLWILDQLAQEHLLNRDLICWCSPLACHGDVLLQCDTTWLDKHCTGLRNGGQETTP